jgi:hypothetical protein
MSQREKDGPRRHQVKRRRGLWHARSRSENSATREAEGGDVEIRRMAGRCETCEEDPELSEHRTHGSYHLNVSSNRVRGQFSLAKKGRVERLLVLQRIKWVMKHLKCQRGAKCPNRPVSWRWVELLQVAAARLGGREAKELHIGVVRFTAWVPGSERTSIEEQISRRWSQGGRSGRQSDPATPDPRVQQASSQGREMPSAMAETLPSPAR